METDRCTVEASDLVIPRNAEWTEEFMNAAQTIFSGEGRLGFAVDAPSSFGPGRRHVKAVAPRLTRVIAVRRRARPTRSMVGARPGCPMVRCQMPARRDVRLPAAALGDDLLAHEEPELDADAGEADAVAARLRARGHVVIARQLATSHARAVVDGREGRGRGVGREMDVARAPESSALATISVRIVSSSAPG
jgi:hypothetical protein